MPSDDRPLRDRLVASSLTIVPARRLRSETRASALSVHQMHATAAIITAAAPAASHAGDTNSLRAVVPTASTHHVRRPIISRRP